MRKLIAMLVAASLLMLFCSACGTVSALPGSNGSQDTNAEESNLESIADVINQEEHVEAVGLEDDIADDVDDMRDNNYQIVSSDVPADEKQIKYDLLNSSSFYYQPGLEITDLQIIKRQTNPDEKTDYVFVAVVAENESIRCNLEYEVDYTLYNEGWIADLVTPYEVEAWKISPLVGPEVEFALVQLAGNYDECNYLRQDLDLENNYCTMYFSTVTHHAYAEQEEEVAVLCSFNENLAEWESTSIYVVNESITWDLAGYWYPITHDSYAAWRHYCLAISDDDPNDNSVYVVVQDDRDGNIYFEDYVLLSSEGCEFEFETYYTMNGTRFTDDRKMVITMDRVCYGALGILDMLDSDKDYARE